MATREIWRHIPKLQHYAVLLMCVGIFVTEISPLPLTFGTFLFALPVLISGDKLKKLQSEPPLLATIFIWLFMLFSGLYSDNTQRWSELLIRKIPLLLLPLGYTIWQSNPKKIRTILVVYVFVCSIISLLSIVNLFFNYEEIAEGIDHSKPVPVWPPAHGISHIYFSIFQSFAVLLCCYHYFFLEKIYPSANEKILALTFGIFNFISLHILSSRTGLFALYASLGIAGAVHLIKKGNIKWLLALLVMIFVFPIAGYLSIDSFRRRIDNTITDFKIIKDGKDINHRSFAMRLEASSNAMEIVKDHLLLGTGAGDLDSIVQEKYVERNSPLREENRIMPHNQFLLTWASTGFGALMALIAVLATLVFSNPKDFLFHSTTLLLALSMFAESILERQNGVTFFCLSILLLLQWKNIGTGVFDKSKE